MMHKLTQISMEAARDAYCRAERARQDLVESAQIKRQIAEKYGGSVCDKRIRDRVQAMLPEFNVAYCAASDSNAWKRLIITRKGEADYSRSIYVYLCKNGGKRIDAEHLVSSAMDDEKQSQKYADLLGNFWEYMAQYNNIVPYVNNLNDRLYTIMSNTKMIW